MHVHCAVGNETELVFVSPETSGTNLLAERKKKCIAFSLSKGKERERGIQKGHRRVYKGKEEDGIWAEMTRWNGTSQSKKGGKDIYLSK